jgi:hypothetical protein
MKSNNQGASISSAKNGNLTLIWPNHYDSDGILGYPEAIIGTSVEARIVLVVHENLG